MPKRDPARRHHDPKHYSMQKHTGVQSHSSSVSEGYYTGKKDRKHLEHEDSMMLSEDHNAVANMPQQVIQKFYPRPLAGLPEVLDDTIRGIDDQMRADNTMRQKNFNPKGV